MFRNIKKARGHLVEQRKKIRQRISEARPSAISQWLSPTLHTKRNDSQDTSTLASHLSSAEDSFVSDDANAPDISGASPAAVTTKKKRKLKKIQPDATLQQMDVIMTKELGGLTVEEFYNIVWKEKVPTLHRGDEETTRELYRPWLEESGKNNVSVGPWQHNEDGFLGEWDKEFYPEQRIVKFDFKRTTHLYTGPPIANVEHTQQCRLEYEDDHDKKSDDSPNDDDEPPLAIRCILAMTVEMEGIPFSDCFNVQIRWIVTRSKEAEDKLNVQVGLHVNFKKQTVLAGKIRSGTSEETTKAQLSLYQTITKAIAKAKPTASKSMRMARLSLIPICAAEAAAVASAAMKKEDESEEESPDLTSSALVINAEKQQAAEAGILTESSRPSGDAYADDGSVKGEHHGCFPFWLDAIWTGQSTDTKEQPSEVAAASAATKLPDERDFADDPVMEKLQRAALKLKLFKSLYMMEQQKRNGDGNEDNKQAQWFDSELTDVNASLDRVVREMRANHYRT